MTRRIKNLSELESFAKEFVGTLSPQKEATVVALYGDLGAGKTTLVQAVAKVFGVSESVQSPTFLILKSYKLKASSYKLLHHVDAYRLQSGKELLALGWRELLADPHNLILIEWADRVADILPKNHIKIFCRFVDENTREFSTE